MHPQKAKVLLFRYERTTHTTNFGKKTGFEGGLGNETALYTQKLE